MADELLRSGCVAVVACVRSAPKSGMSVSGLASGFVSGSRLIFFRSGATTSGDLLSPVDDFERRLGPLDVLGFLGVVLF